MGCGSTDDPPAADAGNSDAAAIVCPKYLELEEISVGARQDVGYTGFAHGTFPIAGGSGTIVETYDCEADCDSCKVRGPVFDNRPGEDVRRRCVNSWAPCTEHADCGDLSPPLSGPALCLIVRDPPQPGTSGLNYPVTYYFPTDMTDPMSAISGTIEFITGEFDLNQSLIVGNHLGDLPQNCEGDATPYDGVAGGTCTTDTAVSCDVHAISNESRPFISSFDCPPDLLVAMFPLRLESSTRVTTWILDSSRPDCTFGGDCFCGMCQDGNACTSDFDCADGMGCGASPGGAPLLNNICRPDSPCQWDSTTQTGQCTAQIPDQSMPGEFIDIPNHPCFPTDTTPIRVSGSPAETSGDAFVARLAGLSCLPEIGNAQIDQSLGFPGPVVVSRSIRVEPIELLP